MATHFFPDVEFRKGQRRLSSPTPKNGSAKMSIRWSPAGTIAGHFQYGALRLEWAKNWCLKCQNDNPIIRRTTVVDSEVYFEHLVIYNVHINRSMQAFLHFVPTDIRPPRPRLNPRSHTQQCSTIATKLPRPAQVWILKKDKVFFSFFFKDCKPAAGIRYI